MNGNPRQPSFSRRSSSADKVERERHEESLEEARRQTTLSEKSLGLSRKAYVVGVIGALLAAIAIVVPLLLTSGPSDAAVQVSAVTVGDPDDINSIESDASGAMPDAPARTKASVVDVTLKNTGDAPAVMTTADFVLDRQAELSDCFESGGEARVSADYTFKIPGTPGISGTPTNLPITVSRPIRFVVAPQSADRLTFSFGPEQVNSSSFLSMIYAGHVVLTTDSGSKVDVGETAVVAPAGRGIEAFDQFESVGVDPACMSENAKQVESFFGEQVNRSPELDALRQRYSKYNS